MALSFFIYREVMEIMYLVASVHLSVCLYACGQGICLCVYNQWPYVITNNIPYRSWGVELVSFAMLNTH